MLHTKDLIKPIDLDTIITRWPDSNPQLEAAATERLTLAPITEADRHQLTAIVARNRARLDRLIPLHDERNGETPNDWFDKQLTLHDQAVRSGNAWRRVLRDNETDAILGAVNLNAISRGLECEADACVWLDEHAQRQGFATEAIAAALAIAFAMPTRGLGLTAVHGGIQPDNFKSKRIAARCGFRLDPRKSSHLRINGRWINHEFHVATPPITG
ncbi:MAG: GNAT family protein [Planctomycetota bacterium]